MVGRPRSALPGTKSGRKPGTRITRLKLQKSKKSSLFTARRSALEKEGSIQYAPIDGRSAVARRLRIHLTDLCNSPNLGGIKKMSPQQILIAQRCAVLTMLVEAEESKLAARDSTFNQASYIRLVGMLRRLLVDLGIIAHKGLTGDDDMGLPDDPLIPSSAGTAPPSLEEYLKVRALELKTELRKKKKKKLKPARK